jgi:histone acetyltransferase (RNA polymerase elongator complex component)
MRHRRVAIFVPHAGCPQQCSFCDQRHISGEAKPPTPEDARQAAKEALQHIGKGAQIAFFGGSFTAMDRAYMASLLEAVQEFIEDGSYAGIRISTRPDAIDGDILEALKKYHVTDIELGAQSMSDEVLQANTRGHTAEDTRKAAKMVKQWGFGLGLQMMTGLYGDTDNTTVHTAQQIAALAPDSVRIYPVLVLRGTALERLYRAGAYEPLTLEGAVERCARLLKLFGEKGVPVIRLGLHDSPALKGSLVAGPYHPAFRELCESRLMLREALAEIERNGIPKGDVRLYVSPRCVSKMIGQKRENLVALHGLGYCAKVISSEGTAYLKAIPAEN